MKTFEDITAALDNAIEAGHIYNVDFVSLKDAAARLFRMASGEVQRVHLNGDRSNESAKNLYFEMPDGLHNFPSRKFTGLVEACTDTEMRATAEALIATWKPVADKIKTVKPMIIKGRKPSTTPRRTPERTIENTGTCSCCGRNVKLKAGKIVAHGYTVRYGWQMGNCFGVGYDPIEVSTEGLVALVSYLNDYIDRTTTSLSAMVNDTCEVYYDRRSNKIERDNDRFEQYRQMTIRKTRSDLEQAQRSLDSTRKSIATWESRPLPDAA